MLDENEGRWCIVEAEGAYYTHTSIRCFFASEEAAYDRWDSYDGFERIKKDIRFVPYGETVDF